MAASCMLNVGECRVPCDVCRVLADPSNSRSLVRVSFAARGRRPPCAAPMHDGDAHKSMQALRHCGLERGREKCVVPDSTSQCHCAQRVRQASITQPYTPKKSCCGAVTPATAAVKRRKALRANRFYPRAARGCMRTPTACTSPSGNRRGVWWGGAEGAGRRSRELGGGVAITSLRRPSPSSRSRAPPPGSLPAPPQSYPRGGLLAPTLEGAARRCT